MELWSEVPIGQPICISVMWLNSVASIKSKMLPSLVGFVTSYLRYQSIVPSRKAWLDLSACIVIQLIDEKLKSPHIIVFPEWSLRLSISSNINFYSSVELGLLYIIQTYAKLWCFGFDFYPLKSLVTDQIITTIIFR